jgi:L-ribulose-5-phosphate 4-epimerase
VAAHAELRERVSEANRALVRAGLVVLTFGNVSAVDRDAGVLAIKPSGVAYDDLGPETMVVVDLERGEPVAGARRPSSDTPTHLVLYSRFGKVGGIVHTHSPAATAWAQAGRDMPCLGTTHADHFRGAVPVTRALTGDEIHGDYEERTGDVIVETFEERGLDPLETPGVLVRSHGPFAWGADVDGALENAVALETIAAIARDTLALRADVEALDGDLQERHFSRKHGPGAYYGQPR